MAQLESVYQMGIRRKQQSSQMVLDLHFTRMACKRTPQMKGSSLGTKITKEGNLDHSSIPISGMVGLWFQLLNVIWTVALRNPSLS